MAQKNLNKKEQTKNQKTKINLSRLGLIILIMAIAVFFIYNNFIKSNNNEVHYYKFTKEGDLTFADSTGKQITKIDIEIADDDYQRQLGLMNRQSMEENQGMLFIFNEERIQSFWMLNTLFSLDIIFINKDKKIVTIQRNTTPLSQQSYPSSAPAMYVLEVNAGFSDSHNIKEGDKVFWIGKNTSL